MYTVYCNYTRYCKNKTRTAESKMPLLLEAPKKFQKAQSSAVLATCGAARCCVAWRAQQGAEHSFKIFNTKINALAHLQHVCPAFG